MLVFLLRFVVFTFQESPKYLLGRGKDAEAIKVLQSVAKVNKYDCHVTLETFAALENTGNNSNVSELGSGSTPPIGIAQQKSNGSNPNFLQKIKFEFLRIKILFSTPTLARLTILVWIIYAFDYWGFSVAGKFSLLPQSMKLTTYIRIVSANYSSAEELCNQRLRIRDLSRLRDYLPTWNSWCCSWGTYGLCSPHRTQMGNGLFFCFDGNIPVFVFHRQHTSFEYWIQRHGVLFPIDV